MWQDLREANTGLGPATHGLPQADEMFLKAAAALASGDVAAAQACCRAACALTHKKKIGLVVGSTVAWVA